MLAELQPEAFRHTQTRPQPAPEAECIGCVVDMEMTHMQPSNKLPSHLQLKGTP